MRLLGQQRLLVAGTPLRVSFSLWTSTCDFQTLECDRGVLMVRCAQCLLDGGTLGSRHL